ncbi:MAG: flagellar biosynthetic protein FliO [Acidimicrobiales bacterium]
MSSDTFLLLVRMGFSLALVFGLMWVAARVMRGRNGGLKRVRVDHLEVVERKPLTKNSSIAIVRVAGETLTVGITDNNVTLLGHAAIEATDADETATDGVTVVDPTTTADVTVPATPIDLRTSGSADSSKKAPARRSVLDTLRDKTVRHIAG